ADAAPSAPGVSRIASVKPLPAREARRAGRRAAPAATTSISIAPRVFAQFASELCGSMSMTQTFSFISCAATASDDAIVLFPEPPFWVTNAMVRMTSALGRPSFAPVSERDQGKGVNDFSRVERKFVNRQFRDERHSTPYLPQTVHPSGESATSIVSLAAALSRRQAGRRP